VWTFTKWPITQPWIIRFRSHLVDSQHLTLDLQQTFKFKGSKVKVTAWGNDGENVLDHQQLHRGLFDFGQIWNRVRLRDTWCTTDVQVQIQRSRSQRKNVVWSPNYCPLKIVIAASKGDTKNLTDAQYKIGQNSSKRLARRRTSFTLQCIRNWHVFSFVLLSWQSLL